MSVFQQEVDKLKKIFSPVGGNNLDEIDSSNIT